MAAPRRCFASRPMAAPSCWHVHPWPRQRSGGTCAVRWRPRWRVHPGVRLARRHKSINSTAPWPTGGWKGNSPRWSWPTAWPPTPCWRNGARKCRGRQARRCCCWAASVPGCAGWRRRGGPRPASCRRCSSASSGCARRSNWRPSAVGRWTCAAARSRGRTRSSASSSSTRRAPAPTTGTYWPRSTPTTAPRSTGPGRPR